MKKQRKYTIANSSELEIRKEWYKKECDTNISLTNNCRNYLDTYIPKGAKAPDFNALRRWVEYIRKRDAGVPRAPKKKAFFDAKYVGITLDGQVVPMEDESALKDFVAGHIGVSMKYAKIITPEVEIKVKIGG